MHLDPSRNCREVVAHWAEADVGALLQEVRGASAMLEGSTVVALSKRTDAQL